jgi:Large ribosomal RNA subunit accumulation protein YceD
MTVELSRPVALAKIGRGGLALQTEATPEECKAVAARMDVPAIRSLECSFRLSVEDDGVSVAALGRLRALLTRVCVVSAEEFETVTEDEFEVRFVPTGQEREDADPDDIDEIPYEGDAVDVGEAAVEQLGLAMDPYPRMEGAEMAEIEDDGDASPFAALSRRT